MRNLPKKKFKLIEIEKIYQNFCQGFKRKKYASFFFTIFYDVFRWTKDCQLFFIWLLSYYSLTKKKEIWDLVVIL